MRDDVTEIEKHTGAVHGVVVAQVIGVAQGAVRIRWAGQTIRAARLLVAADTLAAGDKVAVMCEGGDAAKPIILGRMQDQGEPAPVVEQPPEDAALVVTKGSDQTVISHPRKLRLTCGKAAITLTADGRIELNGEYLLSTAKGTNRIAGASVKIN
ncbi:DUF6484 domain-containing protein [Yoonia sp. R2331]|uniref:DUF6484 domain-containing protein n=1 Tax=Yoonia sp. R2331 TaxID=3237238 RepID=UPI0034E39FD9